jgi:hypothetical protein
VYVIFLHRLINSLEYFALHVKKEYFALHLILIVSISLLRFKVGALNNIYIYIYICHII